MNHTSQNESEEVFDFATVGELRLCGGSLPDLLKRAAELLSKRDIKVEKIIARHDLDNRPYVLITTKSREKR